MVISHLYIFFVELSLRFKWVVFLLLSFKHSYVFLISHYQIGLLEIFSRSTLIVLLFSWHCLLQSDVYLILIKYSILIISFTNCAFDTLSIKLSPYLSSSRLFLLLFSKSLIVLCLYIDLCYTLIFCDSFKLGICLFFLHVDVQLFQQHLLNGLSSSLSCLSSFIKRVDCIYVGLFLGSLFCFTDVFVYSFTKTLLFWLL